MNARNGVYAAPSPDGIALMDIRAGRGQWRFLDPVGARLWQKITDGTPPAAAVDDLTAYWHGKGADPAQVRTDLTALADDLERADLLHHAAPAAQPDRTEVRFTTLVRVSTAQQLAGHAGLFVALLLLRLLPIRIAVAGARVVTFLPGRAALPQEAEAAFAAVRRAARFWPGRAACLEESLAAHFAAALTGHRVRWVVGARFIPQGAHAWIEAGTAIIGQDETDRVWPYVSALQVERSN
ncbi:lasso peptide biosynthesis B2 protein (plasmid) [Streptomyces sp. AM 4-1-1]|uniref:lasso peptide biosynthesis B2 protein n=1 Tax=Streptomyces sp. AM 4-1-1 TaxID=3028710 RepID=UPI0023B8CA15|nr:lasso peptide biosynthesis B2 protein [Streptomyces sp. AM 4-1-1]WEH37945.1 lasso peptide biosynthesis B2 protein [Streptomyces sp. AM 4-1-1]